MSTNFFAQYDSDAGEKRISRAPSFRRSLPKGWESNEPQQPVDSQ